MGRDGAVADPLGLGHQLAARVGGASRRALLRARNGIGVLRGDDLADLFSTPKDVVWTREKARLLRIRSDAVSQPRPLLIVHSLISRSYIFDLLPGNSVVAWLRDEGYDVYLLDWGVPDEMDVANTLETYVDDLLRPAVRAVADVSGADRVSTLAYCFGGILTLLALATDHELPIDDLALVATPVDFEAAATLRYALNPGRLEAHHLIDGTGNVPSSVFRRVFRVLRPTNDLAADVALIDRLWDWDYVRNHRAVSHWAADQIPFPGALMRECLDLMRENALMEGTARVGERRVDFAGIELRVLAFMALRDHIVPIRAAAAIDHLLAGRDVGKVETQTGHVSLLLGANAQRRTLPTLHDWLTRTASTRSLARAVSDA